MADGQQGDGQGHQRGQRGGRAAVEGGVPGRGRRCSAGERVGSTLERPVDARPDGHAEGQPDQGEEAGQDRDGGPAQPVPLGDPLDLGAGARPAPCPGSGLAPEHDDARSTRTNDRAQPAGTLNDTWDSVKISVVKVW